MGQLHRMDLSDPDIVKAAEAVVQWTTISRVCGELAVSRALGDPDFKVGPCAHSPRARGVKRPLAEDPPFF